MLLDVLENPVHQRLEVKALHRPGHAGQPNLARQPAAEEEVLGLQRHPLEDANAVAVPAKGQEAPHALDLLEADLRSIMAFQDVDPSDRESLASGAAGEREPA